MKKKSLLLLPLSLTLMGCYIMKDISHDSSRDSEESSNQNTSISSESSNNSSSSETKETDPELELLYHSFFNPRSDVKITINITNEHFSRLLENGAKENNTKNDIYSPCTFKVNINNEERTFNEVGIRVKGNTSRNDIPHALDGGSFNGHLNFKLSFCTTFEDNPNYNPNMSKDELDARRFGKAKKINLKWNRNYDEEFVKESYASYILDKEGLMAPKINNVKVKFVTETYTREYLYSVQENVDAQFLNRRLDKESREGDLYKGSWVNYDALTLNNSDDSLFGIEDCASNKYYVYDLKTNKKTSNFSKMKNFINQISSNDNGASQENLKQRLSSVCDVDYLLKFMAMEWIISNPDSLRYHYNNTYFYFNSKNNLMYPIMYDNDRCMGIINGWDLRPFTRYPSSTKTTMDNDMNSTQVSPLYWRTILSGSEEYPVVNEWRNKYFDYIEEYSNKYLNVDAYNQYKDSFTYRDNVNGGNYSFNDFVNEAKHQIQECMNIEGR